MSHFSAVVNPVRSLEEFTVNVSVMATAGTTEVFSFQLESSTGTLPLDVHVFLLAAVQSCTQLSFISFQVVQSKSTTSQSVLELGQSTSQAHCPSDQSCTSKLKGSHSSKFIVTVVVFQLLELVTLVIQFQSAPSCQSCQSCPSAQSFQSAHGFP